MYGTSLAHKRTHKRAHKSWSSLLKKRKKRRRGMKNDCQTFPQNPHRKKATHTHSQCRSGASSVPVISVNWEYSQSPCTNNMVCFSTMIISQWAAMNEKMFIPLSCFHCHQNMSGKHFNQSIDNTSRYQIPRCLKMNENFFLPQFIKKQWFTWPYMLVSVISFTSNHSYIGSALASKLNKVCRLVQHKATPLPNVCLNNTVSQSATVRICPLCCTWFHY